MKIRQMFKTDRPLLSFEVFPPVRDADIASVYQAAGELAGLAPDFISVTYGAGGKGNQNTVGTAKAIKERYGVETLAHLTCIGLSRETIVANLALLRENGIENILALRGDLPPDTAQEDLAYRHAVDLIREINAADSFCTGAATHPEGHIDCQDPAKDLDYLQAKVAAGVDFLVTQVFFDNDVFYRFREKALARGIKSPILTGIMPVLSKKQVNKFIYLCGVSLPAKLVRLLVRYEHDPDSLCQAGIEYAAQQVADLLSNGVDGVHLYTMNRPSIAKGILAQLPSFSPLAADHAANEL